MEITISQSVFGSRGAGKGLQPVLEKTNCTNFVKLNSNVVEKCPTIHRSCLVSLDSFYIVVLEFIISAQLRPKDV